MKPKLDTCGPHRRRPKPADKAGAAGRDSQLARPAVMVMLFPPG
jgi:hypothetical protein